MVLFYLPNIFDPPVLLCLEIPLPLVHTLCNKPVKWFRYIGWAILFTPAGYITRNPEAASRKVLDDEQLSEIDKLYYHAPDLKPYQAVDLKVEHPNGSVHSSTHRSSSFVDSVRARDGACVFTGVTPIDGPAQACHLIRFACGSDWMSILANARSFQVEDVDDVRNGILLLNHIHAYFDRGQIALLHTPNAVLNCDDIPPSQHNPTHERRPSTLSTISQRYTMHHIDVSAASQTTLPPNNADARFATTANLPHPPILHYIYGLYVLSKFATRQTSDAWRAAQIWKRSVDPQDTTPTGPGVASFEDNPPVGNSAERQAAHASDSGGTQHDADQLAWDFMFALTQGQYRLKEQERLRRQRLKVADWVADCAQATC